MSTLSTPQLELSTLIEIVSRPAGESPAGIAALIWDYDKEPEPICWAHLWNEANARSHLLRQAGISSGNRVMLLLPTSRVFVSSFFAVLLAGGVPVPVAPPAALRGPRLIAQTEHLKRIAQDCGAVAGITLSRTADALRSVWPETRGVMQFISVDQPVSEAAPTDWINNPDATALLQYTSGSTDRPKGVELTHRNVLANLHAIAQVVARKGSTGLSWLPLYHDMGLIGCLLTALYARCPVILMPPQSFVRAPSSWLRGISDHRVTVTVAPNFAFDYCVNEISPESLTGVRLDSLEIILNGAEPVSADTIERFESHFRPLGLRPGVIRPVYGLAENCLAVTFSGPGGTLADEINSELLETQNQAVPAEPGTRCRKIVSVGRPIGDQRVRIVDSSDHPVADRTVGEIVVQGASVMKGYFGKPEENAATLRNGWLHTGDLGYFADGNLFISGRCKDLIIRHGRNYYPQDIEATAGCVKDVFRDGVAAFSAEDDGNTLIVIIAETRARAENLDQIPRLIRERLHHHFLFGPDEICLVRRGAIPRTTSGKIRRHECQRLYVSGEIRRFELPVISPHEKADFELKGELDGSV